LPSPFGPKRNRPTRFLIGAPVWRFIVPANQHDPALSEAQESIIKCTKDQHYSRSVKNSASLKYLLGDHPNMPFADAGRDRPA
jgi:hypothetical protein